MDFSFDNSSATSSGNIRFSGVSSGINSQQIIDSIIASRRIQVTQIEDKISLNDERVSAIDQLQSLAKGFADSLDVLRGGNSFFVDDVFDNKLAFTSSRATATAPVGYVPSAAESVLGVNATDGAIAGQHTVEVVQIAKAQQIRSDAFGSTTNTLASQGFTIGDFEINGRNITLNASDTLLDLRDKINGVNSGVTATNVNASIVSVSPTESYLLLSSEDTGLSNTITFSGTQGVHNSFGLTSAGTDTVKTEIQSAQNSIIRVDNLGVDVVRESNTIDDVFTGVTLDLFKAEPDTEIVVDIDNDLNAVKTTIVGFLDAYNGLKSFIEDQQSEAIREDGEDPAFGVLAFDSSLRSVETKLNSVVSSLIPGLADGFSSLGQIGISIEDDYTLGLDESTFDNVLLNNLDDVQRLFGFDYSTSDSRLSVISVGANSTYTVDGSNIPEPYYLNISGTDASGDVIDANLSTTPVTGNGGLGDNTLGVNGKNLEALSDSPADGLKLFFNADPSLGPLDDIEVSFTRGIADRLYNFFNDFSKVSGEADTLKTNLLTQNENYQEDITKFDARLDLQRQNLESRFIAMETAMFQLNSLRESLSQQLAALAGGDS
jgi:flagellar hook-associated protein 2